MADTSRISKLNKENREIFERMMKVFLTKISSNGNSAASNCDFSIDSVKIKNSNNCNFLGVSKCTTNNSIFSNILFESLIEVVSTLPTYKQQTILTSMGIKDITSPQEESGYDNICKAEAEVNATINIKNFSIEQCSSDDKTYFQIINTGSAEANCGINFISFSLSQIQEGESELYKKKIKSIFFLEYDYFYYIFLIILAAISIVLIILSFNKYIIKYIIKYWRWKEKLDILEIKARNVI